MRDAESWTFESGKEGVWIRQSSRDWDSGRRTDGWEKAALVQRLSQAQMPVSASFGPAAGAKDVDFGPCVRPLNCASRSSCQLQNKLRRCLLTQHRGDQVSTNFFMFPLFFSETGGSGAAAWDAFTH